MSNDDSESDSWMTTDVITLDLTTRDITISYSMINITVKGNTRNDLMTVNNTNTGAIIDIPLRITHVG